MTFTADPSKVEVGEEVSCTVCLHDDAMPEPVPSELLLRVVAKRKIRISHLGHKKPPEA